MSTTYPSPPPDYTSIQDVLTQGCLGFHNLMGQVTEFRSPFKSRGSDWSCAITFRDEPGSCITFRVFKANPSHLPTVSVGDMIAVRRANVKRINGILSALSASQTAWIIFPKDRIPLPTFKDAYGAAHRILDHTKPPWTPQPPTIGEQIYAIDLHSALKDSHSSPSSPAHPLGTTSSTSQRVPQPLSAGYVLPRHQTSYRSDSSQSLQSRRTPTAAPVANPHTASTTRSIYNSRRFKLLKDLEHAKFADIIGEIVKIYPNANTMVTEVYITDYTTNSLFYGYEEPEPDDGSLEAYGYCSSKSDWPGPYGKMTFCCSLFHPHSEACNNGFNAGDLVILRNVHVDYAQVGFLQGKMHQDRKYPDQIDIRTVKHDDPLVLDVLRRKQDYFSCRRSSKNSGDQTSNRLSKAERKKRRRAQERVQENTGSSFEVVENGPQPKRQQTENRNSKDDRPDHSSVDMAAQPKKQPKPGLAALHADKILAAQQDHARKMQAHSEQSPLLPLQPETGQSLQDQQLALQSSPPAYAIRCANPQVNLTSFHDIHHNPDRMFPLPHNGKVTKLPFINAKFRCRACVVDYYPRNLADFTHSLEDEDYNDDSDADDADDCSIDMDAIEKKWEWGFMLVLEDASTDGPAGDAQPNSPKDAKDNRLAVVVAREGAECLLKMDAVDLRANPKALAELRDKLSCLLGNLAEVRAAERADAGTVPAAPTPQPCLAPPFDCCVAEYGVRDWCDPKSGRQWEWVRVHRMFGTTII
ncbi:hypothetical protein BDY21DRAFT_142402 [Lineolata rhizophorae]|uniref:Protection of telomeres protein 1 n=1 Tax=Lineolata rhizophorae TaxID=578093 RepID=A0A6A6NNW6_9PEZI|nr:hypothetical protein BDY21DRAFT_142402 [Lineolata rhizophorae]